MFSEQTIAINHQANQLSESHRTIRTIYAGLPLTVNEINHCRAHKVEINQAQITFDRQGINLTNLCFTTDNQKWLVDKKLLIKQKEAMQLYQLLQDKHMKTMPLTLVWTNNFIKIKISTFKQNG